MKTYILYLNAAFLRFLVNVILKKQPLDTSAHVASMKMKVFSKTIFPIVQSFTGSQNLPLNLFHSLELN